MSYQCQLCGHDGPLSEPCQRCEESAEFSEPPAQALLHRLRATRAQLLTDDALRQVLAEKEATILSLRHTVDVLRERNGLPNVEVAQGNVGASAGVAGDVDYCPAHRKLVNAR